MMRFLVVLVFVALAGLPARADEPLAKVRVLLDSGDVAGLELAMARLNNRVTAVGDADTIRAVNIRLFETTHPERLAVIHRWADEMPASPYAKTAEAWAALKALEMWSDPSRRYGMAQNNAVLDSFRAARTDALAAVDQALDVSAGTYVPALDVWLRAREIDTDREGFGPVTDRLMELAPDPKTAQIIVRAGVAISPAAAQQAVGLCLQLGELIEDYDSDSCVIDAAMSLYLGDELEDLVHGLMLERNDPRFDAARLTALLDYKRRDPAQVDSWIELHRRVLGPETDLEEYEKQARSIFHFGKRPAYMDEAVPRILAEIDARLADDPFNHILLRQKAKLLLARFLQTNNADDLVAARASWDGLLVYAETAATTWELGADLVRADRDPSDVRTELVFWENAIAYSDQSLYSILMHFYYMSLAREAAEARLDAGDHSTPDPAGVLEDLKCPMLRAARTASALCRTSAAGLDVCDPMKPLFEPVPGILEDGKAGSCPGIAEASLSALTYKATPFAEMGDPWAGAQE